MHTIYFIFALNILQVAGYFANRVVLALFALDLGADPLTVGVLAALFSLAPATLAVSVGKLADRFGARWLLLPGAIGASLGMLLPYIFPTLASILIAGACIGLSMVCFNVTTQNLTGLLSPTPESRTRNYANYGLSNSGGSLTGPLIGGFSIDHFGFQQSCLYLSLFMLVTVVMLVIRRGPLEQGVVKQAPKVSSGKKGGTLAMLGDRNIRRTIITGSFLSSGLNLFTAYMPVYAHSVGISASVIGMILATNSSAAFFIRAVLPRMIARLKEERVFGLSFCCGAISLSLIPLFQAPIVLGLLAFVFGIGMGAGQPIITMLIFRFAPEGRSGEAIGLKITTNHITNMVSPIVFGSIGTALGLMPMFWLNALLMATGARMIWPKKRRT